MFGFVEIVLVHIKLHSLPCTVPWVLTSLVVYPSLENNTEYFCYHSISLVHHLCSQLLELMCFAYIFMSFIFTLFFVCSWLFYWMIIEETPPRYANRITFFFFFSFYYEKIFTRLLTLSHRMRGTSSYRILMIKQMFTVYSILKLSPTLFLSNQHAKS